MAKSRPNAPYMSLPSGGRFSWVSCGLAEEAEVRDHRERDVGERDLDELPSPVGAALPFRGEQRRSPRCRPVAMSHAGSAWFTGNDEPTGPVAGAMPDAAFTV